MSAVVVATAFGGPEVLSVIDEPTAAPAAGQVTIEVKAAGINPADWKIYGGMFGQDETLLPLRVGFEAAGVVTAVGSEGGSIAVGDEVIAFRISGGYAAEVVVDAAACTPKPAGMGWAEAGGLMLTGATAIHMLEATKVADGLTVLVHGGSGGVGLTLLQLLRARDATVVATASERHHDLLRSFGAIPVTYGEGLLERVQAAAPGGVDVALDCVGTDEAMEVSLALVQDRARIATIANFSGTVEGIKVLGNGPGADPGTEIRDEARGHLVKAVEHGTLQVVVAKTFPLAEVVKAQTFAKDKHPAGKVVLIP